MVVVRFALRPWLRLPPPPMQWFMMSSCAAKVCFVLREPDEKIIKLIKLSGHDSFELKSPGIEHNQSLNSFMHYDWLNVSQEYDANETLELAFDFNPAARVSISLVSSPLEFEYFSARSLKAK